MSNRISMTMVVDPVHPRWQQAWPRFEYEIEQQGDTLILRRWLTVAGARRTLWSMQTENITHLLNQASLAMEAEDVGYVRPIIR